MTPLTINTNTAEADAVLLQFAQAIEGQPSDILLADYAGRYPDLARDFGRIALAQWETQNGLTPDSLVSTEAETASAARFRAIGLAALQAARPALSAAVAAAPSPLQSLVDAAKARGLSGQELAARLQIPDTLLLKLHRRLIVAASVPGELVGKMAEAIGRTNDEIAAYLRQPAQMPVGASFRADSAPQAQTETFADALRADPDTTPEHKAAWLGANGKSGGESDRAA